jgi:acyl-coenzyme A thioesterase PaaI-like protein
MINRLKRLARLLQSVPGGFWFLSRIIGFAVPYSGSIGANILELGEGSAVVSLPDGRKVRNHLNSIHALALANLGELTANLALITLCPPHGRFIVTRMETDYLKKGRGELICRCSLPVDLPWDTIENTAATATVTDASGEVVCRVTVYWKIGVKRIPQALDAEA